MRRLTALACLCVLVASPTLAQDNKPADATQFAPSESLPPELGKAQKQPILMPPVPGNQKKFDRAAAAYDAGDYETAFKLFSQLADKYDIAAIRNVALMERDGLGTDKDPEAAERDMERAAERGLPTAESDLGVMLLDGAAGDPDPKAALPWLERAAQAGHPVAQYRLAQLYEEGAVVPRDMGVAEVLYAQAARGGVDEARARLMAIKGWKKAPKELMPPQNPPQSRPHP